MFYRRGVEGATPYADEIELFDKLKSSALENRSFSGALLFSLCELTGHFKGSTM